MPQDPIHYLFIDGGCLRAAARQLGKAYLGDEAAVSINYEPLSLRYTKVFYYDAVPGREHDEEQDAWKERIAPQMAEFEKIRALDGFHVQLGELRGRPARQKRVDVQITVDMLLHTIRKNMNHCTLIAGDLDFHPLIEALVREGMFVRLWHPLQASSDFINAADSRTALTAHSLEGIIVRADGRSILSRETVARRPSNPGRCVLKWESGGKQVELHHQPGLWTIERLDPVLPSHSNQVNDDQLWPLLATAEGAWGVSFPREAWALLETPA